MVAWRGRETPEDKNQITFRHRTDAEDSDGATTSNGSSSKKELLIDGKWIDISKFMRFHPGGKVINYYLGQDADGAFGAFHFRSEKAKKVLQSLPSRPATKEELIKHGDPLLKDFEQLNETLAKEGYFNGSISHVIYRIVECFILFALGMYLVINGYFWTGVIIWGIAEGRCGWVMHEGGHYSLTGNIKIDRHIQTVLMGAGSAMSATYWRNQHNKHHAAPQKIDFDVDLNTLPLVAFNSEVAKRGNAFYLKSQAFSFLISMTLVPYVWGFYLHPRFIMRAGTYVEILPMVLNHVLRIWAGSYHGIWGIVLVHYLVGSIEAVYLLLNFALSHTHKPVIGSDQQLDWVRFTARHTANVEPVFWVDWWMGYLNYQIEHHLFPAMPQFKQRQVRERVRKLFEKHGLEYQVLSYWDALKLTFGNLHSVGNPRSPSPNPAS